MKKIFVFVSIVSILLLSSNVTLASSRNIPPAMESEAYALRQTVSNTPTTTLSIKTDAFGFKIGSAYGFVDVTLSTPDNYATSAWGSTRLNLQGQDSVCLNHGNHPLTSLRTYQEKLTLEFVATKTPGKYDLLIQPFMTDDCNTAIGTEILERVTVPMPCLNCSVKKTEQEIKPTPIAQTNITTTSSTATTQARQERKQKVDAFITTYQNNPDFKEILFLVQLLIALDIIQV